MNLHFLHGFLGLPSDWDIFKDTFHEYNNSFHSISDYLPCENNEISYFKEWSSHFNNSIFNLPNNKQKNVLIGYSLGGRLALHCLCENSRWDAAIIISANPGLVVENEKLPRISNDAMWANRFLNEKWESVIEKWNSQGVFSKMKNNLKRKEKDFNKNETAKILNGFSLGKQENLRDKIKALQIPILWIAGEHDNKFVQVAIEMKEISNKIETEIFHGAGHRVPWENPEDFRKKCLSFLNKL